MTKKSYHKINLLKRTTAFSSMSVLLLMSILALSVAGSGAASAQSNDGCTKLPVHSVVANNEYKEYVAECGR